MKITLCLIGKNNEKTIGRLLDSVGNCVDALVYVDTGSTDTTKEIVEAKAKEHAVPLVMGDFEWTDDFSAARNYSFSLAPEDTDWFLWLDTDDVVAGAEKMHDLIQKAPPNVSGITLPYEYGFDQYGNCVTVYQRERLVKKTAEWEWRGPCHEALYPRKPVLWAKTEEVVVKHYPEHERDISIKRNTEMLLRYWDKAPNNPRTAMYLAYQYFAAGDYQTAIDWFDRYFSIAGAPGPEVWQSFVYKASCLVELDRLGEAVANVMQAISLAPMWKDAYFLMAQIAAYQEQWQEVIWWDEMGRKANVPEKALFINPLIYTWGADQYLHIAYFNLGDVDKAAEITKRMLVVQPKHEQTLESHRQYTEFLRQRDRAKDLARFIQGSTEEEVRTVAPHFPRNLLAVKELREGIRGPIYRGWMERGGRKRIAFICPQVFEPWGPLSLDKGGIGGSETAVVHMARELSRIGHHVTVYNEPGIQEGVHDGVGYFPISMYTGLDEHDLVVAWRYPAIGEKRPAGAKKMWLWCHDLHFADRFYAEQAKGFDRIMPVSKWHENYMRMVYPFLGENLVHTTNGIDPSRFPVLAPEKDPLRCVYMSSPDRGLDNLLDIMPYLASVGLQLHVFYGMDNLEKLAAGGNPWAIQFLAQLNAKLKRSKNVVMRGRLGQKELAEELAKATYWLYPTDFLEVSCITAMEARTAGLVAVTSELGALPETMGDWGIKLKGWASSPTYLKMFAGHVGALVKDEKYRKEMAEKGRTPAPTWAEVAQEWASWL